MGDPGAPVLIQTADYYKGKLWISLTKSDIPLIES
jgi:hypothetical protein